MKTKLVHIVIALCLCILLIASLAGCSSSRQIDSSTDSESQQSAQNTAISTNHNESETHKIAVSIYDPTDDEVLMFRNYYQDYLQSAFNVEFLYSDTVNTSEKELEFIRSAKAAGCEGLISFTLYDVVAAVNECGNDFYYIVGDGNISTEDFDKVKDLPAFLGVIGPSLEDEYNAGVQSVKGLTDTDSSNQTFLILSGGSALNNTMHSQRTKGMLETLQNDYGFTLTASVDELLGVTETTLAAQSDDGGKVYLCPGYYYSEDSDARKAVNNALEETKPDVILSTMSVHVLANVIAQEETAQNTDIKVGAIDCFSENNQTAFEEGTLDYLVGKSPAMSAPAFVAMFDAVTGHSDILRVDNHALQESHPFWYAGSSEECESLRAAAENVYQNVLTTQTLMEAMPCYSPDATYADFENILEILATNPTE